jgi:uncharacterized protein YceK
MKLKLLMIVAVAGMAIAGCSSTINTDGATDSTTTDSTATMMPDTTKKVTDTTQTTPPDTTNKM